jgi:hypothetical protein
MKQPIPGSLPPDRNDAEPDKALTVLSALRRHRRRGEGRET